MFLLSILNIYIVVHALETNAQGQPQNCVDFCNPLSNQRESLIHKSLQRKCDCAQTLAVIPLSTTEPLDTKFFDKHEENSTEIFPLETRYNIANAKRTKRNIKTSLNSPENTKEFPLYLDVNLHPPKVDDNSSLKQELIDMFKKLRESEKYLSECINLHIYIFSNNDILNKTHIKHDNSTNTELLTEINNKCDQPAAIIRESIFQIKLRKLKGSNDNLANEKKIEEAKNTELMDNQESTLVSEEVTTTTEHNTNDFTLNIDTTVTSAELIDKDNDNEHSTESIDSQTINPVGQSEEIEKITSQTDIHPSNGIRSEMPEEDILLTEIVVKELDNGTIVNSVTDKHELDISEIENYADKDIRESSSNAIDVNDSHISNHNSSKVSSDIEGNLFFSFDKKQLPVRFIQNSEGRMHLAVDGFSLCKQIASHKYDKLVFMNMLCNCIQHHNCSYSPS